MTQLPNRLRIARLDSSPYAPAAPGGAPTAALHARINALIRAHLPPITAALFARPESSPDGRTIEWYSELAGQPTLLVELSGAAGAQARVLLANRLASLTELADRLEAGSLVSKQQAAELREALIYPDDESVYTVGGQPVLVFWGHRRVGESRPAGDARPAPPTPSDGIAASGDVNSQVPASTASLEPAHALAPPRHGRHATWGWLLLLLLIGIGAYTGHRLGWGPWRTPTGRDDPVRLDHARADGDALHKRATELETAIRQQLMLCEWEGALAEAHAGAERLVSAMATQQRDLVEKVARCPLQERLPAARCETDALREQIGELEKDLLEAIRICRARPEPQTASATPLLPIGTAAGHSEAAAETSPTFPPCPDQRPPELAPDVAIVLDASGSMRLPATVQAARIQQELHELGGMWELLGTLVLQQSSGPSRFDEAKKGLNSVIRSLPADVDVGMTVLQDCPRAENLGFFSSTRRDELYGRVDGLRTMRGTPLADGIEQAGEMVDGVKAPAVVVVVSDGDDSCGGDPCAAARTLKARKPLLTINVVDIIGNSAGACLADATGGRMLKPEDGLAFEKTIKEAAEDVLKPAYCP